MKRDKGLRADPEKVRAFLRRSQQRARERAGERRAAQERAGKRPVVFRSPSPARLEPCAACRQRRAAHWHHWLSQERIRAYVRSLRIRDDDEQRRLLKVLLHDRRNLSPVCVECHGTRTLEHARGLTPPAAAFEFAAELGPEWQERLRRDYDER